MLRSIIKDAGLIDDTWKIFWMARWETVMAPRLNVEQFVQRISVRQPGGSLLVRGKQVARTIESHRHRETDSCADNFTSSKIRRDFEDGPALAFQVVTRVASGFVDKIRIRKIGGSNSEINGTVLRDSNTEGINPMGKFLPTFRDNDFLVCPVVCVCVHNECHLAFGSDESALPSGDILLE